MEIFLFFSNQFFHKVQNHTRKCTKSRSFLCIFNGILLQNLDVCANRPIHPLNFCANRPLRNVAFRVKIGLTETRC